MKLTQMLNIHDKWFFIKLTSQSTLIFYKDLLKAFVNYKKQRISFTYC